MRGYRLDAVIRRHARARPCCTDVIRSAGYGSPDSASLPAEAGYPHLTVPMGYDHGLPVGLSFIGPAWSDAAILALGHAYEQATHARKPPAFLPSLEAGAQRLRAGALSRWKSPRSIFLYQSDWSMTIDRQGGIGGQRRA